MTRSQSGTLKRREILAIGPGLVECQLAPGGTLEADRVKLDDEVHDVKQWDVVRVAPPTVRAFEAGPDGLELIVVASDRPEGGDGERIEDFWPAGA